MAARIHVNRANGDRTHRGDAPKRAFRETHLFAEYTNRYFRDERVRNWLMCREPEGVQFAETFQTSLSFACLYELPKPKRSPGSSRSSGEKTRAGPDPVSRFNNRSSENDSSNSSERTTGTGSQSGSATGSESRSSAGRRSQTSSSSPFLDAGDFMMFHRTYGQFAVGSLYTTRPHHVLAQLRESVGATGLSTKPKARRFATDLSVDALEMLEFAWMQDESLIINCRRLRAPIGAPVDREEALAIQGDILFYDVIPPGSRTWGTPFKRMVLFEAPVVCSSCGSRRYHRCRCPTSFKRRAPVEDEEAVKAARQSTGARDAATATTTTSNIASSSALVAAQFATSSNGFTTSLSPGLSSAAECSSDMPVDPLDDDCVVRRMRQVDTLANFASRLYSVDQHGAFFVRWFHKVPNSSRMSLAIEPKNPIPYQFLCGTRKQTYSLASLFIRDMNVGGGGLRSDARFYGSLTSGAGSIGALLDQTGDNYLNSYSSDDFHVGGYQAGYTCSEEGPDGTQLCWNRSPGDDVQSRAISSYKHPGPDAFLSNLSQSPEVSFSQQQNNSALPVRAQAATLFSGPHATQSQDRTETGGFNVLSGRSWLPICPEVTPGDNTATQVQLSIGTSPLGQEEQRVRQRRSVTQPEFFGGLDRAYASGFESRAEDAQVEVDLLGTTTVGATNDSLDVGLRRSSVTDSGQVDEPIQGPALDEMTNGETRNTGRPSLGEPHIVKGPSGLPACSECGAEFRKTGNLTRHIQTVHLKKRPFSCPECPSSFGYKTHLNRHIQTVHNKNKGSEHSCSECNRKFRTQQQLERHRSQAHSSGSTPGSDQGEIKCDECGHGFSQKSNLNRHIQTIHQGLRHDCPACSSSFGQRFDLQRHIQRSAEGGDRAHCILLSGSGKR